MEAQVIGQTDVHHFEFARVFEGGQSHQSLLDRLHRDRQVGGDGLLRHLAGVAVHAGGTVHGDDERRILFEAVQNVVDFREKFGDILFQRQFDPGAKHPIEQYVGNLDGLGKLIETILAAKDLAARIGKALHEGILLAFDEVGARLPAFEGKRGQRDQRVAAVVAGTDQPDGFGLDLVNEQVKDHIRQPLTGVFHHHFVGQAAGIGFLFDCLHLCNGYKFHGFSIGCRNCTAKEPETPRL